jgi:hypothetical protein
MLRFSLPLEVCVLEHEVDETFEVQSLDVA